MDLDDENNIAADLMPPFRACKPESEDNSVTLSIRKRNYVGIVKSEELGSSQLESSPMLTNTNDTTEIAGGLTTPRDDESDDKIARELERLFGHEKDEFDEVLGIDPQKDADDPQLNSILKEIKNSKEPNKKHATSASLIEPPSTSSKGNKKVGELGEKVMAANGSWSCRPQAKQSFDLRISLWPCELFMQRRRLTTILMRLLEENLRWHEAIKLKFQVFFGDDSDDEFAVYSPTIELDSVLLTSCIRRISPWVVKYLMRPMRDGLIANRYIFKKLAKRLAHHIIMENQYPNERCVQRIVEDFFCLHQAVATIDDLANLQGI